MVPPGADAEAQAFAGEDVDLGRLLGHERGLALREHDHAGGGLDAGREADQVADQDEHLVERGSRDGVDARPAGRFSRPLCSTPRTWSYTRTWANPSPSAVWAKSRMTTGSLPISVVGKRHADLHVLCLLHRRLPSAAGRGVGRRALG